MKSKLLALTLLVASVSSGCLAIRYEQTSDRVAQTETVTVTARGFFKDTSLAGVAGASTISVTDTNGTYTSARNVGATNLATVVSTNASGIVKAGGDAAGGLLSNAVGVTR